MLKLGVFFDLIVDKIMIVVVILMLVGIWYEVVLIMGIYLILVLVILLCEIVVLGLCEFLVGL